jgi:hypothetical protein
MWGKRDHCCASPHCQASRCFIVTLTNWKPRYSDSIDQTFHHHTINHQHSHPAAMAPPHATVKSSLTTISQTTTRQGVQKSRKQVVEEVEELDDYDSANSMDVDDELEAEGPQPQSQSLSQSASDGALEQLMVKIVGDVCLDGTSSSLATILA